MEAESPEAVATTFLEQFSDGEFDEADGLIHPGGPLEGAGDVAMVVSMVVTDLLAALVLKVVPTDVTETTVIEAGPTTASIEAELDVAGIGTITTVVELRPSDSDERDPGDGRRNGWRVWNVDLGL